MVRSLRSRSAPKARARTPTSVGCAATLSHLGFVVIVPDYYRGSGPPEPDNYDDFETLMSYIGALDFTRCGARPPRRDRLRAGPSVGRRDPVASWGYCTGGTIALFAACLRHDLATSVVFFPSQPTFDPHTAKQPVDVIDLVWNIACPMALLSATKTPCSPPIGSPTQRGDQWDVHRDRVPGAGHAFNAHGSMLTPAADEQSWDEAVEFATR